MGLVIKKLNISVDKTKILEDINFIAKNNETIAVVGSNGAGKTTLLKAFMNHYSLNIKGEIKFNNKILNKLNTSEIAKLGIYYGTQNPIEIEGLKTIDLLKIESKEKEFHKFYENTNKLIKKYNLPTEILQRDVNLNFSGGQKKRFEILQSEYFDFSMILLDEIDSGLDIDSIKSIAKYLNEKKNTIKIIISHSNTFLNLLKIDKVILLGNNKLIKIGNKTLLNDIEKNGFNKYIKNKKKNNFKCLKNI
jgi:Fe-S cluster assembly ATP-binding protein